MVGTRIAQNWDLIPGALTHIAAGSDGDVWGSTKLVDSVRSTTLTLPTQTWHRIPGDLTQVAVGSDSAVWGITATQQIFRFNLIPAFWRSIRYQDC
jgi:hypothetical protein